MIVPEVEKTIISSNIGNATEYKILANAKMMNILSNNIYSNKIRAVMRELSTNAYDSHVAAGKKDVPFDVSLPSESDPTFKIRDYGTGLSPEDVIELYSTYGSSNKTNSNEFVGFMGLGSKSPFSLVSSFTTISYFNGKKHTFLNFKNQQDIPTISLLSTSDTDESNGLEISFLVKKEDMYKFNSEIDYVYFPFDVIPNITFKATTSFFTKDSKLKIDLSKTTRVTSNGITFLLRPENSQHSSYKGFFVKMGNVFYEMPRDYSLPSEYIVALSSKFSIIDDTRYTLVCAYIEVNIGDLDISTSREEIQRTNRSDAILKKKIDDFFSERIRIIENIYETTPHKIQLVLSLSDLAEHNLSQMSFDRLIKNSPNRINQSIDIEYRLFSRYKNFKFKLLNKKPENNDSTPFIENAVFLKPQQSSSSSIVTSTSKMVNIAYSCHSYSVDYLNNRSKIKNILVVERDESRYKNKIFPILDHHSLVILVPLEADIATAKSFFEDACFLNVEYKKLSELKEFKAAPKTNLNQNKEKQSRSIRYIPFTNGIFYESGKKYSFEQKELIDCIEDENIIFYATYESERPGFVNNTLRICSQHVDNLGAEINHSVSNFRKKVCELEKVKDENIFDKFLLLPVKTSFQFMEKVSKVKKVKFLTILDFYNKHLEKITENYSYSLIVQNKFRIFNHDHSSFESVCKDLDVDSSKFVNFIDLLNRHNQYQEVFNLPNFSRFLDQNLIPEKNKQKYDDLAKDADLSILSHEYSTIMSVSKSVDYFLSQSWNSLGLKLETESPEVLHFKKYLFNLKKGK
jgi:hypothetical protein